MVTFDQVEPQDTLLLCRQPWLPYGEVPLVYGSGSIGKGRSVQSLTAAVTNGEPAGLDAETDDDAGDVVMILPEDKRAESAVKRLMAAGADRARVHDFTRLPDGTRFKLSASPRDAGHLPLLRAYVEQLRAGGRNPRMVVIDPIGACIGEGTIQTSKGARYFAEALMDFAESTGVCLPIVAHPVGSGKLQGSHALQQALRVIYQVQTDEADASVRLWRLVKGNDVPPEYSGDVRFTIVSGENGPRAEWLPPETREARQRSWRDDLALRREARAQAVPAAAPDPVQATAPTYTATVAANGKTRLLAKGIEKLSLAQAMCAATPEAKAFVAAGQPLQWVQDGDAWKAGNRSVAWAVVAEKPKAAAV